MSSCDLSLYDHYDDRTGDLVVECSDAAHRAAIKRRGAGAPKWSALERRRAHGDFRDYLEGNPIHCGTGLLMQIRVLKSDDYGEWTEFRDEGVRVRYELAWPTPDSPDRKVVLHADVGGIEFTKVAEPWMRFRWPARGGR